MVSGKLHIALRPGKDPLVPIGQEAGWAPNPAWTLARRGKSLASLDTVKKRIFAPVGNGTATPSPLVYKPNELVNHEFSYYRYVICHIPLS
jgi:hypothetical protein